MIASPRGSVPQALPPWNHPIGWRQSTNLEFHNTTSLNFIEVTKFYWISKLENLISTYCIDPRICSWRVNLLHYEHWTWYIFPFMIWSNQIVCYPVALWRRLCILVWFFGYAFWITLYRASERLHSYPS